MDYILQDRLDLPQLPNSEPVAHLRDQEGVSHSIFENISDPILSEREQLERALLNSEAKYRALYNSTSDAVMLLDQRGYFDCNDAALRIFGRPSREAFIKAHPEDLSPPLQPCGTPSLTLANQMIAEALEQGSRNFEWVHRRSDNGADFPTEVLLNTLELHGRRVIQATVRDITDRKRVGESLSYSVALTNAALESAADGILIVDREGKIARWNQKFIDLWRVPAELLDTTVKDRVLGYALDQLAEPEAFLAKVMELYRHPEDTSQDLIELVDGRTFDRYSQPIRIGAEIVGRFWSFRDITDSKRAEKRRLYSASLIAAVFDSTDDGILVVELSGKIVRWNQKFIDLWKIPEGLIAAHVDGSVLDHVVSQMADPEQFLAKVMDLYQHPEDSSEDLLELADGRLFERTSQPLRIGSEIGGRFWSFRDITERKRAEEKLLYSVSLIDAAFESTDDGILVVDLGGTIVRWNRKFLDLWKLPEGLMAAPDYTPVLMHVVAQLAHPDQVLAKRREMYDHPDACVADLLELADGRLVERYSQPLRIGNEIVGRFWSFRDNTERRRLEEEVRRQNKELEQRVSERTQSLEDANCELLAINSELEFRRHEAEATNKKLLQL